MFKRLSNQKIQFYSLLAILGAIFFFLMVMLLKQSLTCVDDKGCLLLHCVETPFHEDYVTLIETSIDKNSDCRYQLGTTLERTSNKYYFFNDFQDTCQADINSYAKARFAVEEQITDSGFDAKLEAALNDLQATEDPIKIADNFSVAAAAEALKAKYTDYVAFVPSGANIITAPTVATQQICQDSDDVKQAADLL